MLSSMKKVLASVLVASLVFSTPVMAAEGSNSKGNETNQQQGVTPQLETENNKPVTEADQSAEAVVETKKYVPVVDTNEDGTAALSSVEDSTEKTIKVAGKVTVKNVEYTVVRIKKGAFKNAKKATKIVIPDTVKTIDKKAFSGAKKLKTIKFNCTKKIKVKKGAFKGLDTTTMTIKLNKKMSKKQFKKFKKALEKAGFKGTITQ